jgi:hypothetical protein
LRQPKREKFSERCEGTDQRPTRLRFNENCVRIDVHRVAQDSIVERADEFYFGSIVAAGVHHSLSIRFAHRCHHARTRVVALTANLCNRKVARQAGQ